VYTNLHPIHFKNFAKRIIMTPPTLSNLVFSITALLAILSSSLGAFEIIIPPSAEIVTAGESAFFSVDATRTVSKTYQWQRNNVNIPGATDRYYRTPPTTIADIGVAYYRVIVRASNVTLISQSAPLTVRPSALYIMSYSRFVTAGQAAIFSVSRYPLGVPVTFQWQKNNVNIPGATGILYTTPTTIADNGARFGVIVRNQIGIIGSADTTLAVSPARLYIYSQFVTAGQTATFRVSGYPFGVPVTYQWHKNNVNILGATASSYTTPTTTIADNGARFGVIVRNQIGIIGSADATLSVRAAPTVRAAPMVFISPFSQSVTAGATATFRAYQTGFASFAYQWQKNNVDIPGATNYSYTTPITTTADNNSAFTVKVRDSLGLNIVGGPALLRVIGGVTQTPTTGTTLTFKASSDFSGTQRSRSWSYLDSTGTPLLYDPVSRIWKGKEAYLWIWAGGAHPGGTRDAVRRWTAPQAGSISITGNVRDSDMRGGDGVIAIIRKNGALPLWQTTIANGNATGVNFSLQTSVAAGNTIDFVINRIHSYNYDSTTFDPTIVLTPAAVAMPSGNG
jgi:hypothetical protein